MRVIVILLIINVPVSAIARTTDLMKLRKCFHESVLDESLVDAFHSKVMDIKKPNATQVAYQAASYALLAKKTWNPIEKITLINRYGKMIDLAIEKAPKNIEIRFLRLSIDYYTPMILGRKNNVCEDKLLILQLLQPIRKFDVDSSFNRFILYFLKHEDIYDAEEMLLVSSRLHDK